MIFRGKIFKYQKHLKNLFFCSGLLLALNFAFSSNILAQSTDQNAPTPLTTDEIRGQIKARDIGDARLTTYYFAFNGDRGDVFLNVVTRNLNGNIDVFTADTLQPRTRITLYADTSATETGRIVYMRQPEKLILRVQGRTPNDDPATFQIKFAGSFVPLSPVGLAETEALPEVEIDRKGTVRVNSVGTIIEEPKTETSEETDSVLGRDRVSETENSDKTEIPRTFDPTKKSGISTSKDISASESSETTETDVTINIEEQPKKSSAIVRIEKSEEDAESIEAEEEAKRLSKISLKLKLKNGGRFERPMNEVITVNVIKAVLTIVTTDGKIHEFSIFEVSKMTID